jgi:hypothetical protein
MATIVMEKAIETDVTRVPAIIVSNACAASGVPPNNHDLRPLSRVTSQESKERVMPDRMIAAATSNEGSNHKVALRFSQVFRSYARMRSNLFSVQYA